MTDAQIADLIGYLFIAWGSGYFSGKLLQVVAKLVEKL